MISARTYGHSGLSSSAYYYFGIANNFAKLAQAGAVVEAGWLSGYQANFSTPLSNLGVREVNVYNQVTNPNRFTSALSLITGFVIPQFNKRPLLLPATAGWTLFI